MLKSGHKVAFDRLTSFDLGHVYIRRRKKKKQRKRDIEIKEKVKRCKEEGGGDNKARRLYWPMADCRATQSTTRHLVRCSL